MDRSGSSFPAPRRVMTAPQAFLSSASSSSSSQSAAGLVETLYNHPNVKIIAFTASGRGRARSPGRAPAEEEPGTLDWSSQLERTIAVGPFRIYRAPGSVAFLNCGSALQPILPRSQCWCIDEESSKFILQIRRPNYWRIEVPVGEPDECDLAQALRRVLDRILQFEKTACPFKRPFSVPLPERPNLPVKKRPWTPVRRSLPPLPVPLPEASPSPSTTYRSLRESSSLSQLREQEETLPLAERQTTLEKEYVQRIVESEETNGKPVPVPVPGDDQTTTHAAEQREGERGDTEGPANAHECLAVSGRPVGVEAIVFAMEVLNASTSASKAEVETTKTAKSDVGDASAASELTRILPDMEEKRSAVTETAVPVTSTCFLDDTRRSSPTESRSDTAEPVVAKTAPAPWIDPTVSAAPVVEFVGSDKLSVGLEEERPTQESGTAPKSLLKKQPTKPDIYNVIRSYEKKSAAGTITSLDTCSATISTTESSKATPTVAVGEQISSHDADDGIETVEQNDHEVNPDVLEGSGIVGGRRKKLRGFRGGRPLTVPPQLTIVTSPPSKSAVSKQPHPPPPTSASEEDVQAPVSPAGSSDSFHSVTSWHSAAMPPLPDSPPMSQPVTPSTFPYPHDNIPISKGMSNYRDISDLTATPDAKGIWDMASRGSDESSQESAATAPDVAPEDTGDHRDRRDHHGPKCPASEDEAVSTATVAVRRPHLRHRATASSISVSRALSPLPPAANLFSPTSSSHRRKRQTRGGRLDLVRQLPMAIVAKTCEILLSPPSHLINLMLRVAARIAAGEWRGMVFGYGDGGEEIPVHWDYSDDELSDWDDGHEYHDVDRVGRSRINGGTGRSWEVD
ncbi:hypothetical protein SODALDRAFT_296218 [Sodiomyces alkalinus F11]|uniref:Inheritance of peroxisomes protein 1 n=1 Tax=Sodiomyces alkalinus (strain CBS 110278 / VKM F-3762 / F11) TaxID=1314773 RepID=A0A3N2PTQ3_SODAK|nr:hypothetical protein SODALDRAFT_296218 [Sodiomyces alkalinus F11]ROT37882.1 hypothetical protein SODALDRAFT_296218 [Sodiomyces alkalinus F11]